MISKNTRLAFVADGRSPIAINWISYFIENNYEVHLISTQPCNYISGLKSLNVIPLFSDEFLMHSQDNNRQYEHKGKPSLLKSMKLKTSPALRSIIKHYLYPIQVIRKTNTLREVINEINPHIVHAMRIPYEGMLAARAMKHDDLPLIVSVWGNDFTLHANATPLMKRFTVETLQRADALHTDCKRDVNLAYRWGFDRQKPFVVLPGGGGIKTEVFHPDTAKRDNNWKTVINPRGFRAYVCNDTFFKSIPLIRASLPEVRFICTAMKGIKTAEAWVEQLQLQDNIELLPILSQKEMATQFQRAEISLSLTTHDGTPNTLLEAMACGCFPIAGDIESIREWITDGVNGFLVNPLDEQMVANAVCKAFANKDLLLQANEMNLQLIRQRAEYFTVMSSAVLFYDQVINCSTNHRY